MKMNKMTKKRLALALGLVALSLILFACQQGDADPAPTLAPSPIQTSTSTPTAYPTQTPYPTFTPLPTSTPTQIPDIGDFFIFPDDNLDFPFPSKGALVYETWLEGEEMLAHMEAMNPDDGRIGFKIDYRCKDSPYETTFFKKWYGPHLRDMEEPVEIFGDYSEIYFLNPRSARDTRGHEMHLWQDNCVMWIEGKEADGGYAIMLEIAQMLVDRISGKVIADELVFPEYELDNAAVDEYLFSARAFWEYEGGRQHAAFYHLSLDVKKPFVQHSILGIYDVESGQFVGKREYFGYPPLGESTINVTDHFFPLEGSTHQLWLWMDEHLVAILDFEPDPRQ